MFIRITETNTHFHLMENNRLLPVAWFLSCTKNSKKRNVSQLDNPKESFIVEIVVPKVVLMFKG